MSKKSHKIFFSVGEASGDIITSRLITSLVKNNNRKYHFFGIAGKFMEKTGKIRSIFPIYDLSIMGYFEIITKFIKVFYRLIQTYHYVKKIKPDIIITVDSPGFNFLLVKFLRKYAKLKIPIIHYVAPTVWAYKPERVKLCVQLFDHMLVILPFEPPYFQKAGLKCSYVGNPSISSVNTTKKTLLDEKKEIRKRYNLKKEILITVLLGSRVSEVNKHLKILYAYMQEMKRKHNNVYFHIPTLQNTHEIVKKSFDDDVNVIVSIDEKVKQDYITASDLIVSKSGTSILECVPKLIPIIMFYKVNCMTAWLISKKLKIKFFTICNLMMDEEIIPELIQEKFSVKNLIDKSHELLFNEKLRKDQLKKLKLFLDKFNARNNVIEDAASVVDSYIK